jgi:hypothetical protein
MYHASNTSIATQYEENKALCRPTNRPGNMATKKAPVANRGLVLM